MEKADGEAYAICLFVLREPVPGVLFPFFPAGVAGQRPETVRV